MSKEKSLAKIMRLTQKRIDRKSRSLYNQIKRKLEKDIVKQSYGSIDVDLYGFECNNSHNAEIMGKAFSRLIDKYDYLIFNLNEKSANCSLPYRFRDYTIYWSFNPESIKEEMNNVKSTKSTRTKTSSNRKTHKTRKQSNS
jgi:hypothetical protein